jgi:transcriptional regulator with XRE-family HTH domain
MTIETLLEQVRSRRQLPPPSERRAIRLQAGLSLRDIGDALGVSHVAVSRWEGGATPRETRAAYAQLLEELQRIAA